MGIVTAPIEGRIRRRRTASSRRSILEYLPLNLQHIITGFRQRYSLLKVKDDYRRVAYWARRLGEEWSHQEGLLVSQVEYYLEERESS